MFIASNQMDDGALAPRRHFISLNFDRIFDKIVCPWTLRSKEKVHLCSKRNWSRWRIHEEAFSTSRFDFVDFVKVWTGKHWVVRRQMSQDRILGTARIQWAHELPRYQNTWRTWFRPMSLLINQLRIEDWKERMVKNLKQRPSLTSLEAGSQFTMS